MKLNATDAAEPAEMLQLLSEWLARDPGRLAPSLAEFVGHPAYGTSQLRQDLDRFVFLLGGSDGGSLWPGLRASRCLGWFTRTVVGITVDCSCRCSTASQPQR